MAVFEVKTKQSRQTALAAKRHTAERKKKLISKTLQEDIKKRTQQAALNKDKKEKINLSGNKGASTTVTRSNINEIASKGKYSTPTTKNLGSTAKNTTRLVSKGGANAAEGITDSLINVILGTKNPLAYMVNPTTNLGDWFEDTFGKDEKAKLSYKEQQAIGKQNTINETNKLNKGLEIIGRTDLMETVPELTEDEKLHLQIAEHKINMAKDQSKENFKIYQDSVDKNIAKDYTSGWINSAYGGEEAIKKMNEESLITEENFGGQVAQGLGQGLFNLLGGIASGGSNLITGAGIFASASGSSLQEAYQSGAERSDAQKYALMSGGLEAALELATGSIPGLGKNSGLDYLIDEKGIKKISNRFVRELTRFGYRTTGEASEEMLAEFLTPYIQRATYNPNAENATAEQILQAGLSAAIISGVLDGPNTVVNTKQAINDERLKTGIKQNLSPDTAASIRAELIKNGMSSDLATELMNESLKEKGLPNIDTVVTDNTINFYGKQLNSKQIKTKLKQLNQLLPTISDQSQLDRIGNAIASLNYANDILNNGVNLVDIETTYGINKSQNISEKTLQKVAAEKQLVHSTQDIDRLLTSELYDGEFGIQMQNQGQRASTYGNAYITLKPGILNYAIKMYEGDGASNREGIVRENTKQYKNMDDVVKNNPKYYDEILTQKNLPVTKFIDKIILPKDSSQETIDAAKKITENIEFIEVAKAQQAVDVSKEAEIKALESQIKSAQKDYEDAPEMREMLVNELTEKLENLKKEAYKSEETVYNKPTEEGKGVKNENGFRDIQNESRAFVNKEGWGKSSKRLDENLRERLRGTLQQELDSRGYNDSYNNGILKLTGSGNEFTIYENVDGETFHDIFEISRAYTQYGELVDLHDATSDENGIPYSQCDCYISADGMQGFAITKAQSNNSDIEAEFKDSKVRDKNGKLLKLYHGTTKAGFTSFDNNAIFLTDNVDIASDYAGGDLMFDINNPTENLTSIKSENGKNLYFKNVKNIIKDLENYTLNDIQALFDYIDRDNTLRDALDMYEITNKNKKISDFDSDTKDILEEILDVIKGTLNQYSDTDVLPIPLLSNEKVNGDTSLYAQNRKIYEVYADLKNPLIIDAKGSKITPNQIKDAAQKGYDGIIAHNTIEGKNKKGTTYIVFDNKNIKLNDSDNAVHYGDLGKGSDTKYSLTDNQGKKLNKALQEIQNKRNNNIELSEKEFYKLYSAHKILVDNEVEAKKIIDSIQKNGFEGNAGFGTNIIPSNIPYDKNGEPVFVGDKKYAPKQGEYVIFVPEAYVDTKDGRYRVEKGFKPKDFEIAKIERNNQPYYELYLKNMTNKNTQYSLNDAGLKEIADEFGGGDLISVFNMDPNKRGFLRAIESVVREKAKTLDCYVSKEQDLQGMYEKIFGFKTASIMDYNMDYDHDDIAATHNNPQVAFMVNTNKDVKTKHFDKDSYDEAVAYRDSLVDYTEKNKPSEIAEKITKNDDKITVKPDESNIRSWSQTATEGDYEGVDLVKEISGTLDNTYMPEANQKNWNLAVETFDKFGYDKTMEMIKGAFASGKRIKLSDVMLGQKMLQEAAKKGDIENVSFLLQELSIAGTELGQNIQALSVIKKLTPEGQLKVLQKTVDRLKNKFPKTTDDLHLTNEMIDKVLNSETPVDLENNVSEVKELLGQQIKGTFADKMNAWRYFAMLGNPRTHTRNIVSNMTMSFTRGIKNAISRTIETAIDKINPNVIKERSRTWKKASKEVVTYVDDYIKNNKNILSPASKYTIESQIAAEKKAFNKTKAGKVLQKMMDFNSDLLDAEDFIFKNRAFKNTVTEYLTANNIRSEEDIKANPNLFDNAVNYGIEEALKATFQQYSALAETFNSIRNKNKFTAVAMDAVLPFKRTPINIAKTGLAYSPAGLLKTITKNSYDLKKGTINVNQYIDNISQGLTGSMIFLLGYILAENGILTGEPEDTDKEELFEGALGKQNFAINIGGQSFTIDWLTPTSMPLLTGATISNMKTNDNPFNMNTLTSSVTSIFQPLVELSFLQSVDNALSTYSTEGIQGSIEEFMKSYISQYFPTISGQLAKTIDPTIRSSAASKNSPWKFGEEVLRQNMAKIPGLTYLLEPSTDLWGNEAQRSKNVIIRAFENFIAPYSRKSSLKDSVSDELQALYSRTYEDGVIPNLPSTYYYGLKKYVKFDGNQYDMNAKEYTAFKKTYGQTAYKTLDSLFKTNTYKNATDEDKVKLVENAYTYAKDLAKKEFLAIKNVEYTNTTQKKEKVYKDNNIKTVIEKDISYDDAKTLKNYPTSYYKQTLSSKTTDNYKKYSDKIDDIKDKYEDSKKRKTEVIKYVNGLSGLSVAQKAMLIKQQYSSYTKYDRQIVDYVNKQDLTKSQKNDILESLGFTIKNNRVIFKK